MGSVSQYLGSGLSVHNFVFLIQLFFLSGEWVATGILEEGWILKGKTMLGRKSQCTGSGKRHKQSFPWQGKSHHSFCPAGYQPGKTGALVLLSDGWAAHCPSLTFLFASVVPRTGLHALLCPWWGLCTVTDTQWDAAFPGQSSGEDCDIVWKMQTGLKRSVLNFTKLKLE